MACWSFLWYYDFALQYIFIYDQLFRCKTSFLSLAHWLLSCLFIMSGWLQIPLYFKARDSDEVSLPGFEAGGPNVPSNIDPWSIIGDESSIIVSTDRSSCFERNKIALRMEVLCDSEGTNICPAGGVGIYNPGFWGMVRTSWHLFHKITDMYIPLYVFLCIFIMCM